MRLDEIAQDPGRSFIAPEISNGEDNYGTTIIPQTELQKYWSDDSAIREFFQSFRLD